MKNKVWINVLIFLFIIVGLSKSAQWEDWELGGEMGLGVGSGSKSGKILCPSLTITGTRTIDEKFLELGLGYLFGSDTEINYTTEELERTDVYDPNVRRDVEKEVKIRLSVIPMTFNFHYTIYESFYIGAGIGLYHVFYKKEPLGDWRAEPDSEPGEVVKYPATTVLGFQQMVGMEIFPMSENWNWFVGIKSFVTTSAVETGGLMGISLGGKVRYTW
ncbi:MAG: hypothetical protein ACOC5R_00715 [Elusimicrobiota bacterium]